MDLSWLATAGPYGGLVLVILWLSRMVIIADRRHTAEITRVDAERRAEIKRISDAHDAELRRINTDYERDVADLRSDMAELRTEMGQLRAELRQERQARWAAEELAHRLRTGEIDAAIDAAEALGGLHRRGPVADPGDPGAVAGARDEDDRN